MRQVLLVAVLVLAAPSVPPCTAGHPDCERDSRLTLASRCAPGSPDCDEAALPQPWLGGSPDCDPPLSARCTPGTNGCEPPRDRRRLGSRVS